MPAKTEKQRKAAGADLARKRAGKPIRTFKGMSEAELGRMASKPKRKKKASNPEPLKPEVRQQAKTPKKPGTKPARYHWRTRPAPKKGTTRPSVMALTTIL